MRLSILDSGHRLRARLFLAVTGPAVDAFVRQIRYLAAGAP